MDLETAINIAMSDLPEDYIISVRMETGASWVELGKPEEVIMSFGADTLGEAVLTALRVAKTRGDK